ncbi:MAG: hypothetical protein R6U63_10345 [Longimicrobiales bacterium]
MIRNSAVILALVALAACEFPTEPPKWDQTWVVAGESITVSVAELLPAGVRLSHDSTAFETDAPGTSISFSLAEMCGTACTTADGFTVPKPEFHDTLTISSALPGDLVSATLAGGSFDVTMGHNLSFDPLRPSMDPANPRGEILIRVTSNGALVAYDSISGDDQAFAPGTTLSPTLSVLPVEVTNNLDIEIAIYSPEGDTTTIDSSDTLGVTLAPSTIQIAEATVTASAITIDPVTTTMDFGGVDSTLVDRIQSGAIRFDVTNPFTVTGTLDLAFQGLTPAIQRTLPINQGSYAQRLEFSGSELRAILGSDAVDVVASGGVSASDGTVTVTPTQRLVLENEFELVVLIGPLEDL